MMLREFRSDLHIHTCLSPCGDWDMSPRAIVKQAKLKGLDIIGICDHNSAENAMATRRASEDGDLKVLPGMEVTSREEVHILALFDDDEEALKLQDIVFDNLLPGESDEETFGYQVVADENDEVLYLNRRLLIGATRLSVQTIVDTIHCLNGLAIASHIDREGFSIIGQLGFIPTALQLDGLELSPKITYQEARRKFSHCGEFTFVTFSDAHNLDDIGKSSTCFAIEKGNLKEIRKALLNEDGRRVITLGV